MRYPTSTWLLRRGPEKGTQASARHLARNRSEVPTQAASQPHLEGGGEPSLEETYM